MKRFTLLIFALSLFMVSKVGAQTVSLTKLGSTYTQNFDSMVNTGTTGSTMPYGFYFYETNTNANTTYGIDSGSLGTGNTYSYGRSGSTDRSLGSVASGSLNPFFGVSFTNNTGATVTSVTFSFTVEQWRLGQNGTGRPKDSSYAEISPYASGLSSSGPWVRVPQLNIYSPVLSGTLGLLNGNLSANKATVSYTLKGLSITNGTTIWIRWTDVNITGNDDGLAIDDLSITPYGYKLSKIRSVKFPQTAGIPDTTQLVSLKGIALSQNYTATGLDFPIKDSTGSINAINSTKTFSYTPTAGDSVMLFGKIRSANYLTYLALDSVAKISSGNTIGNPKVVTNIANDSLESGLVKINNLTFATGAKWDTTGNGKNGGFTINMTNGTTTYAVWVNKNANNWTNIAPKFPLNLTGIVRQNSTSATTGYFIWPRSTKDVDTVKLPRYKISQVRGYNSTTGVADSAANKHLIYLTGVMNSISLTTPNIQASLIDNSGAITLFSSVVKNYTPTMGDSILARGTVTQFNGLTELTADSILLISKGKKLKTAVAVTKLDESTESGVFKFMNAYIVDSTKWVPTGTGFNVLYTNGKDTIQVHIYNNTDLFKLTKAPKGIFNITGIGGQFKSGSPFLSGYQLFPRSLADYEKVIPFSGTPLYKIRQIRGQNGTTGVADSLNKGKGFIKGVVHSQSLTTFSPTGNLQFSLKDSTGAITVFSNKIKYYTAANGDSILVKGTTTQFNGLTEYTADSIIVMKTGGSLTAPKVVTAMTESVESDIVTFKNMYIVDSTKWVPAGTGFNVNYTNGKDTISVRVYNNTDLFKMSKAPKGTYNITGVVGQFKSASPYIGGYQLYPRGLSDYQKVIGFSPVPLYKIRQLRGQNTSGVADSLNKGKGYIKGIVYSQSLTTFTPTGSVQFALKDSTGAITVFSSKIKYYTANNGDSILVKGTLTQFNGLTEYTADSIISIKTGNTLNAAKIITALSETTESDLVKYKNLYIVDSTKWLPTGTGFNVNYTNGTDTIQVRIYNNTDLFKMTRAPKGIYNITGIGGQFKSTSPYIGGYQLYPRGIADYEFVSNLPTPKAKTPLYKIAQVRGQNASTGVADSTGNKYKFFVKGIVQSPSFSPTGDNFSIKDNTGSIIIFNSARINGYTPTNGDSVMVRGLINQFNGLTEVNADSVIKLTSSSPVLTPTVITKMDETMEATLVKFNNAYVIDPKQWTNTGSGFNVDITNGKDTMQMRITNGVNLYGKPAIRGRFNVAGIVGQFKSAKPFFGGYQLQPRGTYDIIIIPARQYKIAQVKGINATSGIADSVNNGYWLKGIVHSPNLSGNGGMFFSIKDNTGAIIVTSPLPINGYGPALGDSINVRGMVRQFNGLITFDGDSVTKLAAGTVMSPVVVTKLSETTESDLVTMKGYKLVTASKWDTTGNGSAGKFMVKAFNVNGTDTISLQITKGTNLYLNASAPTTKFDVTGIGAQNDPTNPFLQNYYLIPRFNADIVQYSGINNAVLNQNDISIFPNPATSELHIKADFSIRTIMVTDIAGRVITESNPATTDARLDVSNWSNGVYFVRISDGAQYITTKVIKQ